jgi:hypothetical protein
VRMLRSGLFLLVASSSACASIVGFEDLRFDGDATGDGAVGTDGPTNDGTVEGSTDGNPNDAKLDADGSAKTRLREMTFEEGKLIDAATGVGAVLSSDDGGVMLTTPGLRGQYAVTFNGSLAFSDTPVPTQPSELFVTFRFRVNALNAVIPGDARVLRIFCNAADTIDLWMIAEKIHLQVGAAKSTTSLQVAGVGADILIGVHVKLGSPGLAEAFVTQIGSPFGAPFGTLAANIGRVSNVSIGSATAAGGRYNATIDDIFFDTAALSIP